MMAETKGPYWTDPKGADSMTVHQRRYGELLKMQENMKARGDR